MKAMKKIVCMVLTAALLVSGIVSVAADDGIKVMLNGQQLSFDVPPKIINERTMVPLRAIFEALGATVDWNEETQTVLSTKGDTTVKLTVNDPTIYVNEQAIALDSPACMVVGRTFVPVRAVSEAFQTNVDWNGEQKTVFITTSDYVAPDYADITANVNQINYFIDNGMYIEAMQECANLDAYLLSDADKNLVHDLYAKAQNKYNYADITANVNQINYFIDSGMYIEAMQECTNLGEYPLSDEDRDTVRNLYSTAQQKYDEAIDQYYGSLSYYDGTDIPTFDSVTGATLKGGGPYERGSIRGHSYTYEYHLASGLSYSEYVSTDAFQVYIDTLDSSFGWTIVDHEITYNSRNEPETEYTLSKGGKRLYVTHFGRFSQKKDEVLINWFDM